MSAPWLRRTMQAGLAVVACLATLSIAAPAIGQTVPKIDCAKATSTPELNWCSEQELAVADKKLNQAYAQVLKHIASADAMPKEQRQKWTDAVREAQRRWIAFRDHDCGEVIGYEWFGGTGMTGAMLGCKIEKTTARTKEFQERYLER